MTVLAEVPRLDVERFDVTTAVDHFADHHEALQSERKKYQNEFEDLRDDLVDTAY